MNTSCQRCDLKAERRQLSLNETEGYGQILTFSWIIALLLWGLTWWAAVRLLGCMVELFRCVSGLWQ